MHHCNFLGYLVGLIIPALGLVFRHLCLMIPEALKVNQGVHINCLRDLWPQSVFVAENGIDVAESHEEKVSVDGGMSKIFPDHLDRQEP